MVLLMCRWMQETRWVLRPEFWSGEYWDDVKTVGCRWAAAYVRQYGIVAGHGGDLPGHPGLRNQEVLRIAHVGGKRYKRPFLFYGPRS